MHCTCMFLLGSVLLPYFLAYERGYCTINLEELATQAFDKIQIKKREFPSPPHLSRYLAFTGEVPLIFLVWNGAGFQPCPVNRSYLFLLLNNSTAATLVFHV